MCRGLAHKTSTICLSPVFACFPLRSGMSRISISTWLSESDDDEVASAAGPLKHLLAADEASPSVSPVAEAAPIDLEVSNATSAMRAASLQPSASAVGARPSARSSPDGAAPAVAAAARRGLASPISGGESTRKKRDASKHAGPRRTKPEVDSAPLNDLSCGRCEELAEACRGRTPKGACWRCNSVKQKCSRKPTHTFFVLAFAAGSGCSHGSMTVAYPKKPARGTGEGGKQRGGAPPKRKRKSREEVEDEDESSGSQDEEKGSGIELNRRGDDESVGPSTEQWSLRVQPRQTLVLDDSLAKASVSDASGSRAGGSAAGRGKAVKPGVPKAPTQSRKRPRRTIWVDRRANAVEPSTDDERVALEAAVAKWRAAEHSARRVVSVNDAEALITAVREKYLPLLAEVCNTEEVCRRLVASVDVLADQVRQAN
jgi:hypothetical protein